MNRARTIYETESERTRRLVAEGLEIYATVLLKRKELADEVVRMRALMKETRAHTKTRRALLENNVYASPPVKQDLAWASNMLFDEAEENRKRRAHLRVVK